MKFFLFALFFVFFFLETFCFDVSELKNFETVELPNFVKRSVDFTHPKQLTFQFSALGKNFDLNLIQDHELFHRNYVHEIQTWRNGKLVKTFQSTSLKRNNCFYHGFVNGNESSIASISACDGISGLLSAHGEQFEIEPHPDQSKFPGSHIVYRSVDRPVLEGTCGVSESNVPHNIEKHISSEKSQAKRQTTYWVSLLIANDESRTNSFSTVSDVEVDSVKIVQRAAHLYRTGLSQSVEVILAQQITYQNDPWSVSEDVNGEVNPSVLLNAWNNHQSVNFGSYEYDTGHLLSSLDFQGSTVGLASVGGMCTRQGGINEDNRGISYTGETLAHEIGHNLGMRHDGTTGSGFDNSACPESGYVMAAVSSSSQLASTFSSCSANNFQNWLTTSNPTCLAPDCGNLVVEEDEDCDCDRTDPSCTACCDASCKFTGGSVCAPPDPCCNSCGIETDTNKVCRSAVGACDVEETCDGIVSSCPDDSLVSGPTCGSGGRCFEGECVSLDQQCKNQNPSWEACDSIDEKDPCGTLQCFAGSGCGKVSSGNQEVQVADGTPCGQGLQCKNGFCIDVAKNPDCTPKGCDDSLCGMVDNQCGGEVYCGECTEEDKDSGIDAPCFIATAAWGTELDGLGHINNLRAFRDKYLQTNPLGRKFVDTYYYYSPPVADWIAKREWAKAVTRVLLWPLVSLVENFLL